MAQEKAALQDQHCSSMQGCQFVRWAQLKLPQKSLLVWSSIIGNIESVKKDELDIKCHSGATYHDSK